MSCQKRLLKVQALSIVLYISRGLSLKISEVRVMKLSEILLKIPGVLPVFAKLNGE